MLDASLPGASRRLSVSIASGDAMDVRHFHVIERMSEPFEITVVAVSENSDIDFDAVVGQAMTFTVRKGDGPHEVRSWSGLCSHIEQVAAEDRGLSTYRMVLVPTLWLLMQRRNYRMFQLQSEIDIVRKLLGDWGIAPSEKLTGAYKKRKYRVQYGETDYTFLSRMLEDAGVSFYFESDGDRTTMVLHDGPQSSAPRSPAIAFRDNPTTAALEHVTNVRVGRKIRPGKYVVSDHDYRRPASYKLMSTASGGAGVEGSLERVDYSPGAFLFESDKGDPSPVADDKGRYRTDEKEGNAIAQRRLEADRAGARTVAFDTNTIDLGPGVVVSFLDHPKSDLAPGNGFLVVGSEMRGEVNGKWTCSCQAVTAGAPYRPPATTPKPKVSGVESATVVGPAGEEIHTDEFGRVRVHFHWDRESTMDDSSSCWIHVSQPWGGAGYGGTNLPRVGQEVIVDFLGGDPDRPIVIGRVYTNVQKTPYKLPENKTQSGWKSNSTNNTGGYNEIMFEDRAGRELVRMQAERDLEKLVKHDEEVKIGNDRAKLVGHDDTLTVGNDRTKTIGHDERLTIGNDQQMTIGRDRTRTVGNDESILVANNRARVVGNDEVIEVGNSRSKTIGLNESLFVGANQTESISGNRSVQIGENHSESIGEDMRVEIGGSLSEDVGGSVSEKIGKTKTETVALASAETVGAAKALSVGAAYAITVGGMMMTSVGLMQKETVKLTKTVDVGSKITFTCGQSTITMDKDGHVVVTGKDIEVRAKGTVKVNAEGDVDVESAANVNVKGSNVNMN